MPASESLGLPPDFVWGVSTASYQIEGAVTEGGRGPTSWDAFAHTPGRTVNGDTGDVACDHYHRYAEDIALMKELGVDAYRFSFAWSRIQPTGRGPVNAEGLTFYDRLVDALLAAGIEPSPTLFHWDTPLALEDEGGWVNPDISKRFADYANVLGEHFADRIPRWITVNEPVVLTTLGYGVGMHAPGKRLGFGSLAVAHNLLLAHGRGVAALRAAGAGQIGIANNHAPVWAASDHDEDQQAAALYNALANDLFADPLLLGRYPALLEPYLPDGAGDALAEIAAPIDWYGINHYNPTMVAAPSTDPTALPGSVDGQQLDSGLPFRMVEIEGYPRTDFGWPVVPSAFTDLLTGFRDRYGDALPPIYITENGCSDATGPDATGRVPDTRRVGYTRAYLEALAEAVAAGVDVRGYFHWSLLDNFEWAAGYSQRFGLVHTDFETQQRTPKDSYYWYQELIRSQS
ncbi:GH1 family beta-glucosidase [Microbacterium sp. STN6]|uniref:GH1 family beta-glucosidase n=1 Tax=Microbacterium sp. STN6 TaxID=2995588 RepID=UPI002260A3CD|nr:GH1 family beta-glucosidase [Microbacterium sp. STN6]MCX7522874.1 GH1 family beta-glucosidase [Microbacterium sp. STN6]